MGNSLLDFVMAVVRDPEVAARFADDPAGVLADAHLPGVTIADVNNLIPVVADSLAASTPGFGAVTADSGNVWTSGAATAAFDAFDIHVPIPEQVHQPAVTQQAWDVPADHRSDEGHDETPVEAAPVPVFEEMPTHQSLDPAATDWVDDSAWQHPPVDPQSGHHPGDVSGFDVF